MHDDKDHPDVIMLPPFILLIALAAAITLEFTGILRFFPAMSATGWPLYLGLVLVAEAVALGGWALRTFSSVGTNVSPHEPALNLATTGPYRLLQQ